MRDSGDELVQHALKLLTAVCGGPDIRDMMYADGYRGPLAKSVKPAFAGFQNGTHGTDVVSP